MSETGSGQSLPGRVVDRVTRPPVLTIFAALQAALIMAVAVAHLATRADLRTRPDAVGTGDFPAFYTGALMVRSGRGSELYDFGAQRGVQATHFGDGRGYWQPYLNPPGLALLLAPATAFGYATSYRLFAFAMFAMLAAALAMLVRASPALSASHLTAATAVLLSLGYLPVALTTFGGQNTALTLALLAMVYAARKLDRPVLAGVLLGALTFKPQYVPVLGLVFLLLRDVRVLASAAAVALAHYALGALTCGWGWPLDYLAALAEHGPREIAENGPWHFSLLAVARRFFAPPVAAGVTVAGGLLVAGVLVRAWRRIDAPPVTHPAFFGLVVTGTMLLSPHLQYYEAGILVLPALLAVEALLEEGGRPSVPVRLALAGGYLAYPAWAASDALGVQPLFFVLLALFLWTARLCRPTPSVAPP